MWDYCLHVELFHYTLLSHITHTNTNAASHSKNIEVQRSQHTLKQAHAKARVLSTVNRLDAALDNRAFKTTMSRAVELSQQKSFLLNQLYSSHDCIPRCIQAQFSSIKTSEHHKYLHQLIVLRLSSRREYRNKQQLTLK